MRTGRHAETKDSSGYSYSAAEKKFFCARIILGNELSRIETTRRDRTVWTRIETGTRCSSSVRDSISIVPVQTLSTVTFVSRIARGEKFRLIAGKLWAQLEQRERKERSGRERSKESYVAFQRQDPPSIFFSRLKLNVAFHKFGRLTVFDEHSHLKTQNDINFSNDYLCCQIYMRSCSISL